MEMAKAAVGEEEAAAAVEEREAAEEEEEVPSAVPHYGEAEYSFENKNNYVILSKICSVILNKILFSFEIIKFEQLFSPSSTEAKTTFELLLIPYHKQGLGRFPRRRAKNNQVGM